MKTNKKVEILIVEDSPTQAVKLQYILENHDYHVTAVQNGIEALNILKEYKPTLIISDIIMPEMDSYELCKKIKSDKNLDTRFRYFLLSHIMIYKNILNPG